MRCRAWRAVAGFLPVLLLVLLPCLLGRRPEDPGSGAA